ncbi:MAG: LysE family translocator [Pseudomonadota bacterium]
MLINGDLFTAYLIATVALVLLPGPIVTLVVANSIAHGTQRGLSTVAGTTTGNALLVAVGALGLGAILSVVADLITWIRWAGVVYLVYLGIREWRTALGPLSEEAAPTRSARGVFATGVLVAITNPKTIFFYVAFFPQFLDTSLAAGPQLLAMSVAFVLLAGIIDSGYALLAGRVRRFLRDARRTRIRHGLTGTLFLVTGLGIALARRPGGAS